MKLRRICPSGGLLVGLISVFLILAGLSRYIETDSGNILIHDIDLESYEGYLYNARIFRPLQASSMNPRPSVLIVPGHEGTTLSGDHLAMEFARRGFIVLTVEDSVKGFTGPEPTEEPENPIDSAYTFLTTHFYIDPDRNGLITYYDGAELAAEAEHFADFTSQIFVSPQTSVLTAFKAEQSPTLILTAKYESDPEYRIPTTDNTAEAGPEIRSIPATHAGMIFQKQAIAPMLELFHEDLAIPNDSPFWYSAGRQYAQLLLLLRALLLALLFAISVCMSALMTKKRVSVFTIIAGIILPLGFFLLMDELMNFFLVSVRLGSPYHYLEPLTKIIPNFSWKLCACFAAGSLITAIPLSRSGNRFLIDIPALLGILLCLFGFLPSLFTASSGWELLGLTPYHRLIILSTIYAVLYAILLRIPTSKTNYHVSAAILTGLMYYLTLSGLLTGIA